MTKDLEESKKTEFDKLKKKFNILFDTENGIEFLAWFSQVSGYKKNKIVISNTGEINLVSTAYNAARESIYLNLIQYLDKELIKKAEFRG